MNTIPRGLTDDPTALTSCSQLADALPKILDGAVTIFQSTLIQCGDVHCLVRLDVTARGSTYPLVLKMSSRTPAEAQAQGIPINIAYEFGVLEELYAFGMSVPRPLWLDREGICGKYPYFIMSMLDGCQLNLEADTCADSGEKLYLQGIDLLFTLEREQFIRDVDEWPERGNGYDYLKWLTRRYRTVPFDSMITEILRRLARTVPPMQSLVFSNGDLNPTNFLVRDEHLVGLLDFEHSGFSDPLVEITRVRTLVPDRVWDLIAQKYCNFGPQVKDIFHWYDGLHLIDEWIDLASGVQRFRSLAHLNASLAAWLDCL